MTRSAPPGATGGGPLWACGTRVEQGNNGRSASGVANVRAPTPAPPRATASRRSPRRPAARDRRSAVGATVRALTSANSLVLIRSDQSRMHACRLCSQSPNRCGARVHPPSPSHDPRTEEMHRILGLRTAGRRTKLIALTAFLVLAAGAVAVAAPNGLMTPGSGGPQGLVA